MNITNELKEEISSFLMKKLNDEWFHGAENTAPPADKQQAESLTDELIELIRRQKL